MFNRYDTSADGIITFEEFKAALSEANFSEAALKEMFESVVSLRFLHYCSCRAALVVRERMVVSSVELWPSLICVFVSQDVDKDGEVEYTEFIAATLEARGNIEEERIAEAFDRLDTDQSGFISRRELAQFLGTTATSKEVDEILQEADTNNDGQCKSICVDHGNVKESPSSFFLNTESPRYSVVF